MKWVYARGSSLVPMLAGIAVVGGFSWQVLGIVPEDTMPAPVAQPLDLADARAVGHAQMREGLILEGATTVLDALRAQPLDAVKSPWDRG